MIILPPTHWFQYKAMHFHAGDRRPATVREWLVCLYNADVFYGPVPFLKCVALVSWAIAWFA